MSVVTLDDGQTEALARLLTSHPVLNGRRASVTLVVRDDDPRVWVGLRMSGHGAASLAYCIGCGQASTPQVSTEDPDTIVRALWEQNKEAADRG